MKLLWRKNKDDQPWSQTCPVHCDVHLHSGPRPGMLEQVPPFLQRFVAWAQKSTAIKRAIYLENTQHVNKTVRVLFKDLLNPEVSI